LQSLLLCVGKQKYIRKIIQKNSKVAPHLQFLLLCMCTQTRKGGDLFEKLEKKWKFKKLRICNPCCSECVTLSVSIFVSISVSFTSSRYVLQITKRCYIPVAPSVSHSEQNTERWLFCKTKRNDVRERHEHKREIWSCVCERDDDVWETIYLCKER